RLAFNHYRKPRARQYPGLPAQRRHRCAAAPEHRSLLGSVLQIESAGDLRRERAAVDHLVLAEIDERSLRLLEIGLGGGEQHDGQGGVVAPQPLQDVKALLAAQLLQRAPPLVLRLVLGEEPLLWQREVQVEDHEVRQLRLAGQRLRGLAVVVRALERAAAIALLANLAGDAAPAPGDGL